MVDRKKEDGKMEERRWKMEAGSMQGFWEAKMITTQLE